MKAEIITYSRPELKAGQLWKEKLSGDLYLAVEAGGGKEITLVNTLNFNFTWALDKGFGEQGSLFDYVGDLRITK